VRPAANAWRAQGGFEASWGRVQLGEGARLPWEGAPAGPQRRGGRRPEVRRARRSGRRGVVPSANVLT
jgi:hypothetical protein